ncbi:MAG TPA: hypothetical protein VHI98_17275, partial [Vicinamibacterales bacterium]|nr:hypothetical protein [Vicinamibacterales bacterium]
GAPPIGGEPEVAASLMAGADIVFFSGDKLLGGPQAGIIAGRRDLISVIRRHPLMRALRVDKLTYAALEATLVEYATRRAADTVPVMRMIAASRDEIEARAAALAPVLRAAGFTAELVEGFSTIGGGSAPGSTLPTVLLAISRPGVSPDALESQLRQLPTPVIARIENDRVVLDLRTVLENQDALLLDSDFWILDA